MFDPGRQRIERVMKFVTVSGSSPILPCEQGTEHVRSVRAFPVSIFRIAHVIRGVPTVFESLRSLTLDHRNSCQSH